MEALGGAERPERLKSVWEKVLQSWLQPRTPTPGNPRATDQRINQPTAAGLWSSPVFPWFARHLAAPGARRDGLAAADLRPGQGLVRTLRHNTPPDEEGVATVRDESCHCSIGSG